MYIADISCTNATFKHLMYTQEHFYLKRLKKNNPTSNQSRYKVYTVLIFFKGVSIAKHHVSVVFFFAVI